MRLPNPSERERLPEPEAPGELGSEVLGLAQTGDAKALHTLVTTYESRLFAYLSRTTGRGSHVEDLAQETFLRAIGALPRFTLRPPAKLSTWLYRIATNVAADARKKRRLPLSESQSELVDRALTPEGELARRQLGVRIEVAASTLRPEFREAFVLHNFHGLTLEEISYATDAPVATVKTRIHRAKEKLRECLQPELKALV